MIAITGQACIATCDDCGKEFDHQPYYKNALLTRLWSADWLIYPDHYLSCYQCVRFGAGK